MTTPIYRKLSKSDLELVIPMKHCAIVRLVKNDVNSLLTDAFIVDDSNKIRMEYLRFFSEYKDIDILGWAVRTSKGIKILKLTEVPLLA